MNNSNFRNARRKAHLICSILLVFIGACSNETAKDPSKKTDVQKTGHQRPVKGLANIGNTCFINATLQALFATPELSRLLKRDMDKIKFNKEIKKADKKKTIFARLKKLYSRYEETKKDYVSKEPLIEFRDKVVAEVMPNYQCGDQEDAQEFIILLLQRLSSELNIPIPAKSLEGSELSEEDLANFEIKKALDRAREYSVINDMFSGYFRNDLRRLDGTSSTKYERFELLTLAGLEKVQDNLALKDLIEKNLGEEYIEGFGTKNTSLELLPRYLIIHLKRWEFDASALGSKKITKPINFPKDLEFDSNRGRKIYELYATVNQGGTPEGGHYWGYVFKDGKWYKVNDSHVGKKNINDVLSDNQTNYLLFYKVK